MCQIIDDTSLSIYRVCLNITGDILRFTFGSSCGGEGCDFDGVKKKIVSGS